jgi:hypothetical protein
MTSVPSILPVLAWFLPVLVTALLFWFCRGRRIPCPPSCRRCRYDVSRRPDGSQICSECGADLSEDGAIVTVIRPRPRWMTYVTAVAFFAALAWFAIVARRFEWQTWYLTNAPDSWIAWHVEGKSGEWADKCLSQWLARYRADRLPEAQQSRLHDHLIKWQSDLSRPWDPLMGDLLYDALERHKLSPEQGERMLRGAFSNVQVKVRPVARVGDIVPFELSWTGRYGKYKGWTALRGCFVRFDQPPTATPENTYGWGWGGYGAGPSVWREYPKYSGSDRVTPGPHKLHVLVVLRLADGKSPAHGLTPAIEHRQTFDVDVLPKGTPIGEPFTDAKAGAAIGAAMDVGIYHWGDGRIWAECFLRKAPIDRAFDVYVEHDGKAHWIARRAARANEDSAGGGVEFVPVKDSPDIKSMKMILVGSGDALQASVDQQKYWNGTIEFPAVPLLPSNQAYGASQRPKLPYTATADPTPAR